MELLTAISRINMVWQIMKVVWPLIVIINLPTVRLFGPYLDYCALFLAQAATTIAAVGMLYLADQALSFGNLVVSPVHEMLEPLKKTAHELRMVCSSMTMSALPTKPPRRSSW